jgi:hypothetical protein
VIRRTLEAPETFDANGWLRPCAASWPSLHEGTSAKIGASWSRRTGLARGKQKQRARDPGQNAKQEREPVAIAEAHADSELPPGPGEPVKLHRVDSTVPAHVQQSPECDLAAGPLHLSFSRRNAPRHAAKTSTTSTAHRISRSQNKTRGMVTHARF